MIIPNKHNGFTRDGVRRLYISSGGGGGGAPQPTTTITESGPTVTDINRTTLNEIPTYLTNASQDLIARGQALTSRPYEAYTGARVAEFSPDMQTAFGRMRNQQVAPQIGEATGLASLAGKRAMDYGMFGEGVQQYMNPYMQNVVDIERRKAQEAADQQSAALSGQAVRQGAFGGSGAALQQRALRRDTAQQLGDIQAQGLNRAYESAVNQYNQGISSGLAASGQLGGLGQTQFGQEMDITKGLATSGDVQRQREQALLDVGYGDYLTAQKYPYEQLAFQQGLVSGVPYSTTQRTSGQEVSQPGKTVSQQTATKEQPNQASQLVGAGLATYGALNSDTYGNNAKGGVVKRYAVGGPVSGIAGLNQPEMASALKGMSDPEVQGTAAVPGLPGLTAQTEQMRRDKLRMAAEGQQAPASMTKITSVLSQMSDAELQQYAKLNKSDPYTMALVVAEADRRKNGGMPNQGQPKVVDQQIASMALPEETGIAQLPVNMEFAGGGIIAFAQGDEVLDPYDNRLRRGPFVGGITDQPPAPFPSLAAEEQAPAMPSAPNYSGIMGLYGQERNRQMASQEQLGLMRAADLAADRAALIDEEKRAMEFGALREARQQKQEEGLEKSEKDNFNKALIEAGLAMMAGQSPNALLNIAQGAQQGLKGYQGRLQNIQESRERLDESMARLAEIREEKLSAVGARKRELNSMERKELTNSKEAQEKIYSSFADKEIALTKEQAKAASDRALAVWSAKQKGAAGSRTDAANLRLALSGEIKALRNQRDNGNGLSEAEAQQLAQLEGEFRSLTNILGERLGVQGSGTVGGSSTLPAGFKLD